jgi:hypothetical protein
VTDFYIILFLNVFVDYVFKSIGGKISGGGEGGADVAAVVIVQRRERGMCGCLAS